MKNQLLSKDIISEFRQIYKIELVEVYKTNTDNETMHFTCKGGLKRNNITKNSIQKVVNKFKNNFFNVEFSIPTTIFLQGKIKKNTNKFFIKIFKV